MRQKLFLKQKNLNLSLINSLSLDNNDKNNQMNKSLCIAGYWQQPVFLNQKYEATS